MPNLALQFKGDLQNVTDLVPADDLETELLVTLKCTSCQEEHPRPVALVPSNVAEMQKSRGEATLVMNCNGCRRENSASYVVKSSGGNEEGGLGKTSPWHPVAGGDDAPEWQTLCTVEFRGMEPLEPQIDSVLAESSSWKCKGIESGTPFDEVQFEDGEWHDYDEKAGEEVGITDVELRWKRV